MTENRIKRYSMYFTVDSGGSPSTSRGVDILKRNLTQWDYMNKVRGKPTVKAKWYIEKDHIYYFHINLLSTLLESIGLDEKFVKDCREDNSYYPPLGVEFNKGFKGRPYQLEAAKFISKYREYSACNLGLGVGRGKTITSLLAVKELSGRILVSVPATLISQWKNEIKIVYKTEPSDILCITGGVKLKKAMKEAKEGTLKAKFIIISLATYRAYINSWVSDKESYDHIVDPPDLCKLLGVDVCMMDEIHLNTHFHMRTMLTLNVNKVIGITGTLIATETFMKKMQTLMIPTNARYDELLKDPYIDYVLLDYRIEGYRKVNSTIYGRKAYSHIEYEKSVMRNKELRENYFSLISSCVKNTYVVRRDPTERCLIIASLNVTADELTIHLKNDYPQLNVLAFKGNMKKDELEGYDVIIATNMKVGTGFDLKRLVSTIQTVAVKSAEAVIQQMGRLRPPSNEPSDDGYKDDSLRSFVQFNNIGLRKHVEYVNSRALLIEPRSKTYRRLTYHKRL